MTNSCTCRCEHWQPHKVDCPAYQPPKKMSLYEEVGMLTGVIAERDAEIEQLTKERDAARRALALTQEQQRNAHEPLPGQLDVSAICHALTDNCVMVTDPERAPCTPENCAAMKAALKSAPEPGAAPSPDALDAARYRAFRKSSVRTWNLSFPNSPRTEADIDAEQDRWMAEDAARDPKYANSLFPATQKAKDDYFAAQAIWDKSK